MRRESKTLQTSLILLFTILFLPLQAAGDEGVPQADWQAGADGNSSQTEEMSEAIDRYTREYLWAEDLRFGPQGIDRRTEFFQGRHKIPVQGRALYEALDRPDLADRYRRRNIVRYSLITTGFAIQGAALAYTIWGVPDDVDENPGSYLAISLSLAFGGAAVGIIGAFLNPHPIAAHEARELAEERNDALREELGLQGQELPHEVSPAPIQDLSLRPFYTGGGGGLALGFSF